MGNAMSEKRELQLGFKEGKNRSFFEVHICIVPSPNFRIVSVLFVDSNSNLDLYRREQVFSIGIQFE
jgi:hypothetical protein